MSRIRIDLGIARQIVAEIGSCAERSRSLAREAHDATQSAPSYDGQFGPPVRSIGAEIHSRFTRLAQMLEQDAQDLQAIIEAFERADQSIQVTFDRLRGRLAGILERYRLMLAPWASLSTLWAHGMGGNGRWSAIVSAGAPPGISEEVWRDLPLEDKLALWRETRGGNGRQGPETETLPALTYPTPDAGSGPFDSMDPTLADFAFEQVLFAGALQWDLVQDRPDAARHMRHYLEGSGEPLVVDVEELLQGEPAFELHSQASRQTFIQGIEDRIEAEYHGQPMDFEVASPWIAAPYSRSENWYYAMGGFSYAHSAHVTVTPSPTPGESPAIEVDYQMHVWDYYNWDKGKSVTIPRPTLPGSDDPISIPIPEDYEPHISELGDSWLVKDTALARLHLTGLAQEYEIRGQTEVSTIYYTLDTGTGELAPDVSAPSEPPPGR